MSLVSDLRKKKQIAQKDLAEAAGMSAGMLSRIENQNRGISKERATDIAKAFRNFGVKVAANKLTEMGGSKALVSRKVLLRKDITPEAKLVFAICAVHGLKMTPRTRFDASNLKLPAWKAGVKELRTLGIVDTKLNIQPEVNWHI